MAGEKGLLSRARATLEMTEESAKAIKETAEKQGRITARIENAARDIEALRSLRHELESVVERARRPAWVTTVELAAMLGAHEETIRRWVREGRIRGHQIEENGHFHFDLEEVKEDVRRAGL